MDKKRKDMSQAEKAWDTYNKQRAKVEAALDKLADLALSMDYGHLADAFTDDLYEDFSILEEKLEEEYGPNPDAAVDEFDDEDYEPDEPLEDEPEMKEYKAFLEKEVEKFVKGK
jgi:cephalosporin hydroxylase